MRPTPRKWLIALALIVLTAPAASPSSALAASGITVDNLRDGLPFQDIGKMTSEQKAGIRQAVQAGFLHGDPNGAFRPFDLLTRQEMAMVLTQVLNLPAKKVKSDFTDVESSSWSSPYIEAVHQAGLMNGDGDGKFRPKGKVTREEMAVLLIRVSQLSSGTDTSELRKTADWEQVSVWAKPYVTTALNSGSLGTSNGKFDPRNKVTRGEMARILLSTFIPKDHLAHLQRVEDGKVRINGIEYKLADSVKGVLNSDNSDVLKDAGIEFTADQHMIRSITKLEIRSSGQAPPSSAPEFSSNLVLDGLGAAIDGDLTIAGDFVTVKNLEVINDFTITPKLGHDFYAYKLKVHGDSRIQGGDQHTVLFDSSQLQAAEVSKPNVHVITQNDSTVQQMTVISDATIENDTSSTLQQVTLASGAQQVELQGTVKQLTVTSNQPTKLTGNAAVESLVVNNSAPVNLAFTGTIANLQVNNPSASVNVSSATNVMNTVLAPGVTSSAVVSSTAATGTTTTPIAANTAPLLTIKYSDQEVTVGNADSQVDLLGHFTDAEQTVLKYTAVSLNSAVCTVKVEGTNLIIKAVGKGTATISLAADDLAGKKTGTTFKVKVNEPPVSAGIPDQNKELGSGDVILLLGSIFTDSEHDPLSYDITIADPTIAAYSLVGDKLVLTPAAAGNTNVTVKASDGRGGSLSQSFQLTVTAPVAQNQKPTVTQAPANQSLIIGDTDYSLDLGSVFADPEQDSLSYQVVSTDVNIASAEINGALLQIHALNPGSTTIQLKALDGSGNEENTSFQVEVTAPSTPAPDPTPVPDPSPVPNPDPNPSPNPIGANQAPEVVSSVFEQVLTVGVTNPRTFDLTQLFQDKDGDHLTYTAVSQSADAVNAGINGDMLTLTPGSSAVNTQVTLTADDGHGGTATYDLAVRNAPLVTNGNVEIRTKQSVRDAVTYDLSAYFPNETSFKVYTGTPDSTFTGPSILNGTIWTWNGDTSQSFWIVGANGSAVVIHVTAEVQGPEDLYFSQYLSIDKTRTAIELYFNPVGDTSQPIAGGYELEIHQYNPATNTPKVWSQPLLQFYKGMPYIFIDTIFYDFFDIINAWYYNDELGLFQSNTNFTTGYVLKKNGQIIDVLGDPYGTTQFMPNGGTIVRKSGIRSGSSSFSQAGEWNSYPVNTLQFFGSHTP